MQSLKTDENGLDLIVIGGGLAGLLTAALSARAGRTVTVLERAQRAGGRAITRVEEGIHFNLGPHALYRRGHAARLLAELGVRYRGGLPDARRAFLTDRDRWYPIPRGLGSIIGSRLLTAREKVRFLRLLGGLPRTDARRVDRVPFDEWIREAAGPGNLARLMRTLVRVGTYIDDHRRLSAGAAIDQLKLALGGVWYLDGGWQVLVDGLRDRLSGWGVAPRTGCRAASVRDDGEMVTVELASGEALRARTAVLAIDPAESSRLLGRPIESPPAVRAACLDVALSRLPRPDRIVAFGLDRPLYASVHSASARLAPDGAAVIHVLKYLGDGREEADIAERELEEYLEVLQPGWRDALITRRFLPGLTVSHALPTAETGGLAGRPGVAVAGVPNVFRAGDWVGASGMLADASAASAEEAARRVLDATSTRPGRILSHAVA